MVYAELKLLSVLIVRFAPELPKHVHWFIGYLKKIEEGLLKIHVWYPE